jgi:predicted SprT family Zn-dependent metalloprotease
MGLSEKALKEILFHELCHAYVGEQEESGHGPLWIKVAAEVSRLSGFSIEEKCGHDLR